jgi:hypothetical protein
VSAVFAGKTAACPGAIRSCGLVITFSLVQEQNNARNLEAQVGTEANNLAQLDRLLVRFGVPWDDALRISLPEYAN